MKINIPASIINILSNQVSIDIDFNKAPETVKQKVIKATTSLWYLIYHTQINDKTCESLYYYTHISKEQLHQKEFTIKYNKQTYYYSKFISILECAGLVEVNDKYSKDTFSKSYRVNKDFIRGNDLTPVEIDFRLLTNNTHNKSYWLKKYPQYAELIKDCYRTKVDLVPYIKWLNENIGIDLGKSPVKKGDYTISDSKQSYCVMEDRVLDTERIMRYTNSAIKNNIGNLWFKVSNEGRFYTSIINLSSTAVPFLLLNKRKLKSIDIANSQPLLLASMVDNRAYKKDCGEGKFYGRIMKVMGLGKEEVKNRLYKYLFFTNNALNGGGLYKAFDNLYPGLVEQINAIKERVSLAHLLQTMEAGIIVEGAGRLDFPKLLRHDQVLMFEENYDDVANYLKAEYRKIGLEVTFKS